MIDLLWEIGGWVVVAFCAAWVLAFLLSVFYVFLWVLARVGRGAARLARWMDGR